jgi:hypothetical protein
MSGDDVLRPLQPLETDDRHGGRLYSGALAAMLA